MREVVLCWGEDTIDVQYADNYEVAGIPLVRDGRIVGEARGRIGLVSYAVGPVTRPVRSLPYTRGGDRRILPYVVVALVAHLLLWRVAIARAPDEEHAADVTIGAPAPPTRRARVTAQPAYAANPKGVDTPKRQAVASRGKRGAAARVGTSTGTARQHASAEAFDAARVTGMLDQLSSDRLRVVTGALDLAGAMAKADLGSDVAMAASFGTSFGGGGGGGGGTGWGTIGTGRYGSLRGGIGDGERYTGGTYEGGYTQWPRRELRAARLTITKLEVEGDLDQARVRRLVKRHLPQLTSCFEKQTLVHGATADVVFAITSRGTVDEASTRSPDDLSPCLDDVIQGIAFPSGGTSTLVTLGLAYRGRVP